MAIRTREETRTLTSNWKVVRISDGVVTGNTTTTYNVYESSCEDVNDNMGGNNPLEIVRIDNQVSALNGTDVVDGQRITLSNVNNGAMGQASSSHYSVPSPSGATLQARMSPSKPHVSLPNFLFELKDIPGMASEIGGMGRDLRTTVDLIKRGGDFLIGDSSRKYAELQLNVDMGIAPLLGDLERLYNLGAAFERRKREIERMNRKGGLRKSIQIGTYVREIETTRNKSVFGRGNVTIRATETLSGRTERWATSRWKPKFPASAPSTDADVLRSILGLNFDRAPKAIWDAIPWTFVADYFSDIGDILENTGNALRYECYRMSMMTHTEKQARYQATYRSYPGSGWDGTLFTTRKSRTPISASLIPSFAPFISAKQLSNLGNLAVARRSSWRN